MPFSGKTEGRTWRKLWRSSGVFDVLQTRPLRSRVSMTRPLVHCRVKAELGPKSSQTSGQSFRRWTVLSTFWNGGEAAEEISEGVSLLWPLLLTAMIQASPSLHQMNVFHTHQPSTPFWIFPKHIRPSLSYSPNLNFPEIFLHPYTLANQPDTSGCFSHWDLAPLLLEGSHVPFSRPEAAWNN